jgi:hypothetical protein
MGNVVCVTSKGLMKEAYKSFPSGHTSCKLCLGKEEVSMCSYGGGGGGIVVAAVLKFYVCRVICRIGILGDVFGWQAGCV